LSIIKQWLLIAILIVFVSTPVFADESWVLVETDKMQYSTGESLSVTGHIMERKMPVIAMSIYDPDGTILSANTIELQDDDSFSKTISLDSPFYDKSGIYLIDFDYGKNTEQISFEIISTQIPQEFPASEVIPEVIFLITDKESYQDNDFIEISGMVSAIADPTILVGIYDPNGMPTGFYTSQISPDLEFSVSFLAKNGINFKIPGTYSVKAHYGDSKYVTNFEFVAISPSSSEDSQPIKRENKEIKNPVSHPITTTIKTLDDQPKQSINHPQAVAEQNVKQQTIANIETTPEIKKPDNDSDNLTVEDVELGEMLNEINLSCDTSEYLDSLAYYDGMGPALMRLCKYDQAISYFDQSLIEDPTNVEVITNKGIALGKLGELDAAIAHYDLALEMDPTYLAALNNKANILAETGELEEAIEIYNSVLEHDSSYTISQTNLLKVKEKIDEQTLIEQKIDLMENNSKITKVYDSDKIESTKTVDKIESPPSNILEQIGGIFASLLGFLK
jgi:hypothetical protein